MSNPTTKEDPMLVNPDRRPLLSAFVTGVFMGLAAPALLLASMAKRQPPTVSRSLAQDWEKIGRDFHRVAKSRLDNEAA
jgi:hypothetical protein